MLNKEWISVWQKAGVPIRGGLPVSCNDISCPWDVRTDSEFRIGARYTRPSVDSSGLDCQVSGESTDRGNEERRIWIETGIITGNHGWDNALVFVKPGKVFKLPCGGGLICYCVLVSGDGIQPL